MNYANLANTGLRGCVVRPSEPFVDDFGNLTEFYMPNQNLWAKSYYCYHTAYVTGIDRDDLYIV